MIDLEEDCELIFLSESNSITNFDCGNADLNYFFATMLFFTKSNY
jgi:hypothetical protein